jgi:hypothetical protein
MFNGLSWVKKREREKVLPRIGCVKRQTKGQSSLFYLVYDEMVWKDEIHYNYLNEAFL